MADQYQCVAKAVIVERDFFHLADVIGIFQIRVKVHQQINAGCCCCLDLRQCLLRVTGLILRHSCIVDALQTIDNRPGQYRHGEPDRQAGEQLCDPLFIAGFDKNQRDTRVQQQLEIM